jgi:predicted dehydrogenase
MPVRFGIVGTGMIGKYHAQAVRETPGAELVAVCRSNPGKTEDAAREYGVACEPSYEALLARSDVDAVCLCTPSGLHAVQTLAAARVGKHVLVEKPMALTLLDADAMIAACREADVRLGVALQRRTDPTFRAVRAAVEAGELGSLVLGATSVPYVRPQSYYDSAEWRGTWAMDGGGALMNQGIHLADLLLWFMGDVAEVDARSATLAHDIEVEDCVTARLRFTNGALGTIVATTAAAPGFPHRVEVYGSKGGVQIEGEDVVRWEGASPARVTPRGSAAAAAGAGAAPTGIKHEGHVRLVADLVAAIRERRAPIVSGEEGRRSLSLVLAVYESARTGRLATPR